jgi:8-oxo-dGTP pyrophosphatase MutT (NUDIX family)
VATLDLAALTHEPFCAGVVVLVGGRLVLTLNDDHVPADVPRPALRVGGVGGGQEPGENVWECAYREAYEELSVPVQLLPAHETWLVDEEDGTPRAVDPGEGIAPLLVTRAERPNPDVPFADGLPTGPVQWTATFLAFAEDVPRPGDVEGLLLLAPDRLAALEATPTVGEVRAAGAEIVPRGELDELTRLWLHPNETTRLAATLLPTAP